MKFKLEWTKKYHVEGEVIIEADSSYDAEVIAWGMDQDEWGNGDEELHHDESNIFCVTQVNEHEQPLSRETEDA